MKQIGFAPELVELIKNGTKTLTYRLGEKYDSISIGNQVEVVDSSTDKPFGIVEITEKSHANFSDLPICRIGHEIYKSRKEMRKIFSGYYNQPILDHYKFLVLEFKIIKIF
ncbi:hypothetical protein A3F00_03465 [Candidatus Daviesbacteria bacterium RIFCSPHIGHO2_12_FULL_37_11]|uniref:ASCH domain-containing protein n=1 Tax=Candidatus Daviesbacteria bacterium RIFCSPHIGHO2_12_FULL_37_11 TaxID=1797777 RepID=A0A1F5KD25_9BACT|nr:MAG: hypothetical protein A2111_00775 [Candidatus Daviesbacteria bacterium GWA1_38_6]OGE18028.1 MAG: hypothetical protein A2769_01175 [Candidatus Daviesbacteria bacterium RIFCSPHIGHO2_01_FULL_37_27]OGE38700.1 MAG: hypothetical protein A3F00_03465 [Candidatus Daviesbacteria bacterium RIFCSPHIGHO2_12_FULL_37_11]OGE45790.1 MAG: hypothetical protein A3B39_01005 [Candidatus Daviesbacteria bacterium RIFCSPLOWO2_01_FULL_37_10]